MLRRKFGQVFLIAGLKLGIVLAGYCSKSYQCPSTCTKVTKYSTSCGFWYMWSCTKYKQVSYSCTETCYKRVCCSGYTGSRCSTALCYGRTYCLNGGTCVAPNQCHCGEGLILSSDRYTCIDVNECGTNNGGCEQKCINENGSYHCECNDGYKLNQDLKTCSDVDECSVGISECAHECNNTEGSYTCSCHQGYELALDKKLCEDVDECAAGTDDCSHLCDNAIGSFFCSCRSGYELQHDSKTCIDIDECTTVDNDCEQVCVSLPGSYRCECGYGFRLNPDKRTCTDVDECDENTSGCLQTCENTVGSFVCGCEEGYVLDMDNKTCLDTDDCVETTCFNGGSCIDGIAMYSCVCVTGFTGDLCESDHSPSRSDTVFTRHLIPRQLLPRGCDVIPLSSCKDGNELKVLLSSTSRWYTLHSDNKVLFTHGIVFAEVNSLSLPVALNGAKVNKRTHDFSIEQNVNDYQDTDGKPIHDRRNSDCVSLNFTSEDVFDFIFHNSFFKTYIASIGVTLPDWLSFSVTNSSITDINDLKADLVYGYNIDSFAWCKGAPVLPDHLYSVFNFDSSFELSIYEDKIKLPKPLHKQKFCLIVDFCHSSGGSAFLMVPKESEHILSQLIVFKRLHQTQNLLLKPRGIGISVVKGINVLNEQHDIQLWNGDHLFQYPVFARADIWLGGDIVKTSDVFTAECSADIYVSVPRVERILSGMFLDEWNIMLRTKATFSPILKFRLFGELYTISFDDLVTANTDVFVSVGGSGKRQWCGDLSSPPGIFLSALIKINPFQNVPILQDWVIENAHTLYAYVTADIKSSFQDAVEFDALAYLSELDGVLNRLKAFLRNVVIQFQNLLSENSEAKLNMLENAVNDFQNSITEYISIGSQADASGIADAVAKFWKQTINVETLVSEFLEAQNYFHTTQDELISGIRYEIANIKRNLGNVIRRLSEDVGNALKTFSGFGLKYTTTLRIFGLKIGGIDIELVASDNSLMMCSRFDKIKNLLKGKPAVRFIGRVSYEERLGYFLKIDRGIGIGGALGKDSLLVILQLNTYVNILGIKTTADLFISNTGLHLYIEGNVWGVFLAQIDISAEIGKDWYQLTYNLQGRFVAKSRRRRQVQTESSSFQSSYHDALKKVISIISSEADKRLTQAQNALTLAQSEISKAQSWLDKQKRKVRNAHAAFDYAVAKLENAKDALEKAKGPFLRALAKLEKAQRRVDNLCKMRKCGRICLPGIRCKWCRGWISYPCCRFTSCMISFPNPLCVLANLLCAAVRAIAFLALEVAKIFVRIPMLAFDVAKAAVSVAQFVVDNSRVVLLLAEGVLEVANLALEAVKGAFELAKFALEAVKIAIKTAAKVLEFVIEYGLKNILDVRNCGFNIEVSTTDLPVFDVFCEINAFKLGWKTIRMRINFRNILQTIWQAAKAAIKIITQGFANIFGGRKRREIAFDATSRMHVLLRHVRQYDDNSFNATLEYMNDTINVINYTQGFRNSILDDYGNRVLLFEQKCNTITTIHAFLHEVWETLFELTNETKTVMDEAAAFPDPLLQYDVKKMTQDMTLENANISSKHAFSDYNLTKADLDKALEDTKASAEANPLMQEISSTASLSKELIKSELDSIEHSSVLNSWIVGMENLTKSFFNASECVDLRDCILYSISELFDLYMEETHPHITEIKQTLSNLEDDFISIIVNTSQTVANIFNASVSISAKLKFLEDSNVFCSTPPQFLSQPKNVTVDRGLTVLMECNVTADPPPRFWWFKNGEILENETSEDLVILSATDNDEASYQCMAGNIVANISSNEAFLKLGDTTIDTEVTNPADPEENFLLICYPVLLVLIIANAVFVALQIYRVGTEKKNTAFAFRVILPASAMCILAIGTQTVLHYTAKLNCDVNDGFIVPMVVMVLTEGISVAVIVAGRHIAETRKASKVVPTLSWENSNITVASIHKDINNAFIVANTRYMQESKLGSRGDSLYNQERGPLWALNAQHDRK